MLYCVCVLVRVCVCVCARARKVYVIYNQLTNSMEQSPSLEAHNFSASQEVIRLLWNPKVHYRVYKSWPVVLPEPDEFSPHSSLFFLQIHSNIIVPSTPRSWSGHFPSCFPIKVLYAFLISSICVTCPPHLILLDLIIRITFGEAYEL